MKPPNELQIRTQAERILERFPAANLLAFFCAPGYTGAAELPLAGRTFRVVELQSPLHFFQVAAAAEMDQLASVALCPQREWLSQDLRARVPEGELRPLDPWETVRHQFRATEVESALLRRKERDLPQWILELGDDPIIPAAPGGTVTQELYWKTLLRAYFGLDNDCHDALQFLLVLTHKLDAGTPRPIPAELLQAVSNWLSERGGPPATQLLNLYVSRGATDTLALACVFEALFLGPAESEILVAQGRLERYLEGRPLSAEVGSSLGRTVRRLLALPQSHEWLGPVLTRARQLLTELRAEGAAAHSLIFEEGWDHALSTIAGEILAGKTPDLAVESLHDHILCESRAGDLELLEMAVRLQRFLAQPSPLPRSLPDWVEGYVQVVAWADRAAQTLTPLTGSAELNDAFQYLLKQYQDWREPFNEGFARAVASGAGTCGVETFLSQVVAPLLSEKGQRLLVLVLDGCSQPVLLDLLDSLDQRNWSHYLPDGRDFHALLSAFPSVTEVTRTSLLCGEILAGDAKTEKDRFCTHPVLKPLCRKDYGPQLFHKKDLEQALQRIRSEDYKLVGVVVNAIDDTLAKEEQLSLEWTSELIAPLEPLLQAAREQNRLVLLVSDHGHVLENGTVERQTSGGAGNRWQPGSEAQDGEVIVTGPRLRKTDSARVLWTEKVRYGPKKRGYHGGLSPQEMVCALALLGAPGQKVKGWREAARPVPSFWFPDAHALPFVGAGAGQGDLFAEDAWERFLAREEVARRGAVLPVPPRLPDAYELLSAYPEGLPLAQLASQLGLTRAQLTRMLSDWTHWMNIEGRALLRVEGNRARIDVSTIFR